MLGCIQDADRAVAEYIAICGYGLDANFRQPDDPLRIEAEYRIVTDQVERSLTNFLACTIALLNG